MNPTHKSKQNLRFKFWFKETNYPAKWLSQESVNIINKIMKKNE